MSEDNASTPDAPLQDPNTIVCSFCGHQDGIKDDETIIIVGTMGANICEPCVRKCVTALYRPPPPKSEDDTQS